MKKSQPRQATRCIWAKPWWILGFVLCLVGTPAGCGHPAQGSTEKTGAVLRASLPRGPARGPLHIYTANSRYFADDMGKIVYLTGSHTWNNFQDWGSSDPPPGFDYEKYLDFLVRHDHNFFRLFVWEQSAWVPWSREKVWFTPLPYQRTGPGTALDGEPRFNLRAWNPQYVQRLRARVREAGDLGIYVSVMLFNGWSVDGKRSAMTAKLQKNGLGDPWRGHPFNPDNNINGIDGGGWGKVHTLQNPTVTELQKAYVRKVTDTVGDLDNVLWEISNESNPESTLWKYEMIRFVHQYEATRPKQHPVGMTVEFPGGSNADLWQSPADWISPRSTLEEAYAETPPTATGGKVIITDTDHIWGIGGSQDWVWKSFTRGLNPIFMDPYDAELGEVYPMYRARPSADPTRAAREREWAAIRNNLGYTRAYSTRMTLASMMPHGELASSGYCLANPGSEYLVYLPAKRGRRFLRKLPSDWFAESVEVDLSRTAGDLQFEWFEPDTETTVASGTIAGGGKPAFAAPVRGGGLVLYIHTS
jgi:hypothetical protein